LIINPLDIAMSCSPLENATNSSPGLTWSDSSSLFRSGFCIGCGPSYERTTCTPL
jgi:hypothetical protein